VDIDPGRRRLHPRITDSDWLVLRKMRPAIEAMAVRVAEAQKVVIDRDAVPSRIARRSRLSDLTIAVRILVAPTSQLTKVGALMRRMRVRM
jgi:hypothetical protein